MEGYYSGIEDSFLCLAVSSTTAAFDTKGDMDVKKYGWIRTVRKV